MPGFLSEDVDGRRLSDLSSSVSYFLAALVRGLDLDHHIAMTLDSSRGRTIPTNATSYLPIGKRYMGCHPQTKRRRKTYAITCFRLALGALVRGLDSDHHIAITHASMGELDAQLVAGEDVIGRVGQSREICG
jgi:hypothetical protein